MSEHERRDCHECQLTFDTMRFGKGVMMIWAQRLCRPGALILRSLVQGEESWDCMGSVI